MKKWRVIYKWMQLFEIREYRSKLIDYIYLNQLNEYY